MLTTVAGLILAGPNLAAADLTLEWSDNSDNELGFRIERARSGESFSEIATVPAGTVRFTDRNAGADTVYLYRIRAYNEAETSAYSNIASNGPILTAEFESRMPTPVGSTAILSVAIAGLSPSSLRWQRSRDGGLTWSDLSDNATFAGTAGSRLEVISVTEELHANLFRAAAASPSGTAYSHSLLLQVGNPSRLANFSIRTLAGPEAETLILGFVIEGTEPKSLLMRGIGPTLAAFGVENPLVDPQLAVYSGPRLVAGNDDWEQAADATQVTTTAASLGAFPLAPSSRDAAVVALMPAGAGTAQLSGKGGSRGIALLELYDTEKTTPAQVVNLSARTLVGLGDQTPIVGFSVAGQNALRVLIRVVGPTLTSFGVGGVAANPRLAVFREGQQLPLLENDDWGGSAALKAIFTSVGAFTLPDSSRDAATVIELTPGTYTVQVSSSGESTGVALFELYELAR